MEEKALRQQQPLRQRKTAEEVVETATDAAETVEKQEEELVADVTEAAEEEVKDSEDAVEETAEEPAEGEEE